MILVYMFDCRVDIYYRLNSFYFINKGFDLFILVSLFKYSSLVKKLFRFCVFGFYIYYIYVYVCVYM